jgi:hypothetical protein
MLANGKDNKVTIGGNFNGKHPVDQNRFVLRLLADYNPSDTGRVTSGSKSAEIDANYDKQLCMKRAGATGDLKCRLASSGCLKNIVTRYMQFIELRKAAKKSFVSGLLDLLGFALDLLGMLPPPVGPISDLVNAGLAFGRQKWLDGTLSVLSAIPVCGWVFGALKISGKVAIKGSQHAIGIINSAMTSPAFKTFAEGLAKMARRGINAAWNGLKHIWNCLKKLGSAFGRALKHGTSVMGNLRHASKAADGGKAAKSAVNNAVTKIKEATAFMWDECTGHRSSGLTFNDDWIWKTWDVVAKTLSAYGGLQALKDTGTFMGMASPCLKSLCKQTHQLSFKADNSLFKDSRSELYHKCLLAVGATTMKKLNPGLAPAFDASVSSTLAPVGEAAVQMFRTKAPTEGANSQQCAASGENGAPAFGALSPFWSYGAWANGIPATTAAPQPGQAPPAPPARFRSREPTVLQVLEDVDQVLEKEMDTLEKTE